MLVDPREEVKIGLFVIAGEEVGFDEIPFCLEDELRSLREQRPPGEEVRRAPFRWSAPGRR
ncbi:hypothetical protein CK216_15450 [Mesorhizobium sp. WSM3876]|nr:hypothetical protein CK216_15450 [Mesorhizobium sp. WSM3876]